MQNGSKLLIIVLQKTKVIVMLEYFNSLIVRLIKPVFSKGRSSAMNHWEIRGQKFEGKNIASGR
jgi:hypothetical protein